MSGDGRKVHVAIRVRPVLKSGGSAAHQQEKFELMAVSKVGDGGVCVEEAKPGTVSRSQTFTLDQVFDGDTGQLELYEDAVVEGIDDALIGRNFTCLAYGQTGSGKTHTILGDVKPNPLEDDLLTANSGVFLRVLSDLLEYRQRKAKDTHVVIGLSCIEIYNDNIRDLFGGKITEDAPQLKVAMVGDTVLMPGLITKEVTSMMSVFAEIQLAIGRRQSRATEANSTSSRSHCLFHIDILQQSKKAPQAPKLEIIHEFMHKQATSGGKSVTAPAGADSDFAGTLMKVPGSKEPAKFSRILIADLAGSEKIAKSGVTGEGMKEAISINNSLTALGNVVHSLHQGASHVKYRDSSLTRLLMPSFSQETSRILLLAHCSPTQLTYDESVSTLHFANKVKAVKVATTMTEVDNSIPLFLESVKANDAYTADLRIFAADTQAKPKILHRNDMSLLSNRFRCSAAAASTLPSETERSAQLASIGAMRRAEAAKEEVAAAERAEAESLKERLPEMVTNYMASFRARCSAAREAIAKCRGAGLPFLDEASEDLYLSLCEDADAEFAAFESAEAQGQLDIIGGADKAVSAELAKLRAIAIPKIQMEPEFVEKAEAEDQTYALACAAHCNGRRFLNSFLEMRDTHAALLTCLANIAAGEIWRAKQPKSKRAANAANAANANANAEEEEEAPDV